MLALESYKFEKKTGFITLGEFLDAENTLINNL